MWYRKLIVLLAFTAVMPVFQYLLMEEADSTDPGITIEESRDGFTIDYVKDLQYIAIGPERFRDELKPLLEWKTQKGVRARFYPLDTDNGILENYEDRDKQAEIRSFIIDAKAVNPSIKWVLLAGDGEIIPSRRTFTNESYSNGGENQANYVNSDFYYAGLTGNWDQNGNEIYGEYMEQDWEADVYVGRFPASNEKEIRTMVSKQVSYEKDPPTGSWADSMLLAGSLMDTPNDPNDYQSYKDNSYELVLRVEEELPDHVTPFHLVDYPKLEYGGYNQMFDTLNRSSFEAFYEMGHSSVLIACHGDPFNGNCTNYRGESGGRQDYIRDYEDHFTYDMAETIENGDRLPLVYISSCGSTTFMEEDDTNMERLLRNENGGAIALIGATVDTYRGEFRPDPEEPDNNKSFGNWWLAQEFFRMLYNGINRPGEALYKQKWNYINHVEAEYSYYPEYFRMFYIDNLAYNLLGDPEGPIWTQDPKEMIIDVRDRFVYDNESMEIIVYENDGTTPLKNALVTITCPGDDKAYSTERTDAKGMASLKVDREDLRELTVTVSKDGYIPEIKRIEVYSDMNIAIDNMALEPEIPVWRNPIDIKLTLSNTGDRDIEAFQIHLTISDDKETQVSTPVLNFASGMTINKTIRLTESINKFGQIKVDASIEIVSFRDNVVIESTWDDNTLSRNFLVNYPIEVADYLPPARIFEDSSLSQDHGLMNLSKPYVFDQDGYPSSPRVWAEVIQGDITVSMDGYLLDIIPSPDWSGTGIVRVFASDGSVTRNGTIAVEVVPTPDPPQFIEYPRSVNAREDLEDTFQIIVEDIDSQDVDLYSDTDWITIEKVQNNTGLVFNLTASPSDDDIGESIITITARDESNLSEEIRINVYVESTNDPPKVQLAQNLTFVQGTSNDVHLSIEDPDGDSELMINITWDFGSLSSRFSNFTLDVPDDAKTGEYNLRISVDDGSGGVTIINEIVTIEEKERGTSYLFTLLIIVFIIALLLIYGIFIRVQESRQKRMLDSVGTSAPLEVKALSEKDFTKRRRRRTRDDGLPMPPAPSEVEGALIKEEKKEVTGRTGPNERVQKDLDSEVEDVLSELFPMDDMK